jgi:transcription initiation factor TFIID subunit TAF12
VDGRDRADQQKGLESFKKDLDRRMAHIVGCPMKPTSRWCDPWQLPASVSENLHDLLIRKENEGVPVPNAHLGEDSSHGKPGNATTE